VSTQQDDPVIRQFRDQISDNDLKLLDALNKRLKLVSQLRDYKLAHDFDFVVQDREQWMLTYLDRANRGPISAEGLREIYDHVLSLTKAEILRDEEG